MYPPIFSTCAAVTAVTDLLGLSPTRLYPFGDVPQGVALPYAVWQQVGGEPENYLADDPDTDSFTLQVDVYSSTEASALDAAKALRNAIQGQAHIVGWRGFGRDATTGRWRYSFDVQWWVNR